jgi:hypothetical protein
MADPKDMKVDISKFVVKEKKKAHPKFAYSVIKATKTKGDLSLECIGIYGDYMEARRNQFSAAENLAEEITTCTGKACVIKRTPTIGDTPYKAKVIIKAPRVKGGQKVTYIFSTLLSEVVN